jgi:repressor LexA
MFSNNKLTPRQKEILEYLRGLQQAGSGAPTYREIAEHFGFKSTKAAADHVVALEKKGHVRRRGGRSRGIEVLGAEMPSSNSAIEVPLLGNIPAGIPEEKTENWSETIIIDRAMLGPSSKHRLFALKVSGQSMKGCGINEGDVVVADTEMLPSEGDAVVALIDGENTLKTLAERNGRFFLKAENPEHGDLIPIEEMVIQGVVRAVLRRIH